MSDSLRTNEGTARRLEEAVRLARRAGDLVLEYYQRADLEVESKADSTPVTVADRSAEEMLRELIADAFPGDAILGEEFPPREGDSGYRWILDPIDGTKSFIHGVPLFGTLIGVEHNGESVLGVIHVPAARETVYAASGGGAWHQLGDRPPRPARVSNVATLSDALFLTSSVANFDRVGRRDAFDRLTACCKLTRTWGDCFGYLLVATGRAEVMIDAIAAVWDMAALKPIIEEAGGRFTDWQGRATIYSGQCVATNGALHDEVLALTASGS